MTAFVDWGRQDWDRRYAGEAEYLLRLAYRGRHRPVGHTLVLDARRAGCAAHTVRLEALPDPFALSAGIARAGEAALMAMRDVRGHARLFDGPVVRVADVAAHRDGWTLRWQRAGYFDYVRSNLGLDRRHGDGTLRNLLHRTDALPAFGRSPLADALGLAVLLVTADGLLVVQRRARDVSVWPGAWGPSAAGMVTPDEIEGLATLADLWPFREAWEELGIETGRLLEAPTRFLGLTRELVRGGAPELLYAAHIPIDAADVRRASRGARDAAEYSEIAFLPLDDLDRLQDALGDEVSDSLLAGIALMCT